MRLLMKLLMVALMELLMKLLMVVLMKLLMVATAVAAGGAHLNRTFAWLYDQYSMLVQGFSWLAACAPCRLCELY